MRSSRMLVLATLFASLASVASGQPQPHLLIDLDPSTCPNSNDATGPLRLPG